MLLAPHAPLHLVLQRHRAHARAGSRLVAGLQHALRAAGLVDVQPIGAVTVGLAGERMAELGAMATSAARVRIFSDDGHCVADPGMMRRALEYVKAFDGVIAQHAEEPRPRIPIFQNPKEISELARGWLQRARRTARAAARALPGTPRIRLPRQEKRPAGAPAPAPEAPAAPSAQGVVEDPIPEPVPGPNHAAPPEPSPTPAAGKDERPS